MNFSTYEGKGLSHLEMIYSAGVNNKMEGYE